MQEIEILAYLDHNVLDLITKDDPHNVKELLIKGSITPVYSDESLREIERSVGFEESFLSLLEDIGAKHIEPILDEKSKQTGKKKIHSGIPHLVFNNFKNKKADSI